MDAVVSPNIDCYKLVLRETILIAWRVKSKLTLEIMLCETGYGMFVNVTYLCMFSDTKTLVCDMLPKFPPEEYRLERLVCYTLLNGKK